MTSNFDETKLEVFYESEVEINPTTFAVGRVYSYDGGDRRMKILSRVTRKDGSKRTLKQFPPLINDEQAVLLTELINKCKPFLSQRG